MSGSAFDFKPSPRDVIVACLSQVGHLVPIEKQADLIVDALTKYGHLPAPDRQLTARDVESVAQWLAETSGHPRYTQQPDGWRRLLETEGEVILAGRHAHMLEAASEETVRDAQRTLYAAIRRGTAVP